MRTAVRAAILAALVASACGSGPEATITVPSRATDATSFEEAATVANTGDPAAVADERATTTALATTAAPTTAPAAAPAPATTASTPPPPQPSVAPAAPPATDTTGTASTTTEPTAPTGDPATEEVPPAPGLLLPVFFAFEASDPGPCPDPVDPDDPSADAADAGIVLRWEVAGTESVSVAVDDVDSVVHTGLPPAGTLTVARNCPDSTTYFVVAENPDGRTVQEATR